MPALLWEAGLPLFHKRNTSNYWETITRSCTQFLLRKFTGHRCPVSDDICWSNWKIYRSMTGFRHLFRGLVVSVKCWDTRYTVYFLKSLIDGVLNKYFHVFQERISHVLSLWMECCHFLNKKRSPLVDFFQNFCFPVLWDMLLKQMPLSLAVRLGSLSVTGMLSRWQTGVF